jgi:four helix bundle protein
MGKSGFKDLNVWQKSKSLAVQIYKVTGEGRFAHDFGLRDQMRRASVSISICSNIAEGDERNSNRDSIRFFHIAKGSLAELVTQIEIADEIGYLDSDKVKSLIKECDRNRQDAGVVNQGAIRKNP